MARLVILEDQDGPLIWIDTREDVEPQREPEHERLWMVALFLMSLAAAVLIFYGIAMLWRS